MLQVSSISSSCILTQKVEDPITRNIATNGGIVALEERDKQIYHASRQSIDVEITGDFES